MEHTSQQISDPLDLIDQMMGLLNTHERNYGGLRTVYRVIIEFNIKRFCRQLCGCICT